MEKKHIAGRLTFGMLVICTGLTLLMNTMGYLSWDVWGDIVSYWPVLLIIAGINIIFERSAAWHITYITPLIVVGVFALVITGYNPDFTAKPSSGEQASGKPFDVLKDRFANSKETYHSTYLISGYDPSEVKKVDFEINGGAGEIRIADWDEGEAGEVLKIDATTQGFTPKIEEDRDGSLLHVSLFNDTKKNLFGNHGHDYGIALSPNYVYNFEINTGAGELAIDLSKLETTGLQLNSGAATLELTLPTHGGKSCDIEINSGASELTINVPKGVEVKLEKNGIATVESKDLVEEDGVFRGEGEEGDPNLLVNIELNSAVSTIKLKAADVEETEAEQAEGMAEDESADGESAESADDSGDGTGSSETVLDKIFKRWSK